MAEQNVVHIVPSYTLAASGAVTAGTPTPVANKHLISLYCKYTRGGNGGALGISVCFSPDGNDFYQESRQVFEDLIQGADDTVDVQRDFYEYLATGASEEDFMIEITHRGSPSLINAHSMRCDTYEVGNTGAPGVVDIVARFEDNL